MDSARILYYFLIYLSCLWTTYAHEPNEAYFNFNLKENTVEIEAELPWTMRHALILFNPSLEHSRSKRDFKDTFVQYIKKNLVLKNKNGNLLEYKAFKEIEKSQHAHQSNFLIIFKGNSLSTVYNTIMFNLYENQTNYNTLESTSKTYETNNTSMSFTLGEKNNKNLWYLGILAIAILYIAYLKCR